MRFAALALSALLCSLAAAPLRAQDAQPVQVHGFGSLLTGWTDGNRFRSMRRGGDAGTAVLALHVGASLSDQLRIATQVHIEGHDAETETHIDMALAEWAFSPTASLRLGQVPQPFGIYTELFDVGTTRPFLTLPQSVYGAAGLVAEGIRGASLAGTHTLGGWALSYDAYGGAMQVPHADAPFDFVRGDTHETDEHSEDHHVSLVTRLLGARVVLRAPVDGLSVGASAYSGQGEELEAGRSAVVGVHAEYVSDAWSVRSEGVSSSLPDESVRAAYAEVAYRISPHWQVAVQGDAQRTTLANVDGGAASSLLRHAGVGAGLSYWFAPGMVVKASYYGVTGNRFASPPASDLAETMATGRLRPRTHVLMAGAQFSF